MKARQIRPGVHSVGAVHWDARLFDGLIPLPDGTTYNSYLLRGSDGTALIDTVDPLMTTVLLDNLSRLGVDNIDFVVANHAEQDHSGSLPVVLDKYRNARVICTPKCKEMLVDLALAPDDRIRAISDGETVALGDKTLEFIHAPWVHWPETMFTYVREDKILFSCDFFGSHLATSDLYVTDEARAYEPAKRYYAEIMMPFRTNVQKNLEKIKDRHIDIIAPSHGPLYAHAGFITDAYRAWAYDDPRNLVVLPYVSMHGSTRKMVQHLVNALVEREVAVQQFELPVTDLGKLAMSLVDAATLVIATPTVLAGPHPAAVYAAFLANALRPKLKFASVIGSYGWGGRTVETISSLIPNLKAEMLPPIICKGHPREADYAALDNLAETIAGKHRQHRFT